MDAHALLTSQGWRGTGNSLHPTSNTIGLSRPLLVSKKVDNLGIGKKQHRTSDMWWMNAFDSSLKGLDTSKDGTVVQTVTSGGLDMVTKAGAKWVGSKGGLYSSFVRGESLSGTITPTESTESTESDVSGGKKRKRDGEGKESKEERRARKAAKRAAEPAEAIIEAKLEENDKPETKEERRARKAAKRALREKKASSSESSIEGTSEQEIAQPESKEDRKERKRLKKLAEKEQEDAEAEKAKKKKKRRKDE